MEKKKKIILFSSIGGGLLVLALVLVVILVTSVKRHTFVGEGTLENPYAISTKSDLVGLSNNVNIFKINYSGQYFELKNDISLEDMEWTPIGYEYIGGFAGNFDGKGFTISNFKITKEYCLVGFFGNVWAQEGFEAKICNLNLSYASVSLRNYNETLQYAGLLVANSKIPVDNCVVSGSLYVSKCAFNSIGFMIANTNNMVSNCRTVGNAIFEQVEYHEWSNVSENKYCVIGGVVGVSNGGDILNNTNSVKFTSTRVQNTNSLKIVSYQTAGIVGALYCNDIDGIISNCTNNGDISMVGAVGGIIGTTGGKIKIEGCLNTGNLESKGEDVLDVGGIVSRGFNGDVEVLNCVNNGNISSTCYAKYYSTAEEFYYSNSYLGGIVGSGDINIKNCVNYGDVFGSGEVPIFAGGIIGGANDDVSNCISYGNVRLSSIYCNLVAGGIIGVVQGNGARGLAHATNNYTTGVVEVKQTITDVRGSLYETFLGAAIGYNMTTSNTIQHNYYVATAYNPESTSEDYNQAQDWHSNNENKIGANINDNGTIALSTILSETPLTAFGVYVDEIDRAQNPDNVWVFRVGERPTLFTQIESAENE